MPNHIKNRLEINGEKRQVDEVLDFLRGEPFEDGSEMFIDFNKIIPMPESLNICSGSWVMPLENPYSSNTELKGHIDKMKEYCENNPKQKEKTVNNFIAAIKNYIEYGHATWYKWSTKNWGTKWNAYNQDKLKANVLAFDTAWGGVPDLIEKLALKFPHLTFIYEWSDEDTGCNCGILACKNGKTELNILKNGSFEAYELAFKLRPEYKKYYELVDGEYKYVEEE